MTTQARWVFLLVGDDRTGKTTFQKALVRSVTSEVRDYRLDCNLLFDITHPSIVRKIKTLSVGNRSLQERMQDTYKSIDDYFSHHFQDADIAVISTHLSIKDAEDILRNCHSRLYNVCAVFFSNSVEVAPDLNSQIGALNWDDRWKVENPRTDTEEVRVVQMERAVQSFVQMLIECTRGW